MKKTIGIALAMTCALAGAQNPALSAKIAGAKDMAVVGNGGWLFFVPGLRYLAAGPFWGPSAATASHAMMANAKDPLPAILDFNAQLARKGIKLIVVPVPAKAAIYPDKLGVAARGRLDSAQAQFLSVLNRSGVATIDLTPAFQQARATHPNQDLYCKTDTHWSGYGIAAAVSAIAPQVRPYARGGASLSGHPLSVRVLGDMASMLPNVRLAPESVALTQVSGPAISRQSPILLLGDSHNLVFSAGEELFAKSAGFPENLALRLKTPVDVVAVRGSGATPARANLVRRGDQLAGKRVVVWVFTAREFTEGQGWKKLSVIK